jgi:hypothetical protein
MFLILQNLSTTLPPVKRFVSSDVKPGVCIRARLGLFYFRYALTRAPITIAHVSVSAMTKVKITGISFNRVLSMPIINHDCSHLFSLKSP